MVADELSPEVLEVARQIESARRALAAEARDRKKDMHSSIIPPTELLKAQAYLVAEKRDMGAAVRMVATLLSL